MDKFTIKIGRNRFGYWYIDKDAQICDALMLDAFGLLIARLAGTIQAYEVMNKYIELKIDITRHDKEKSQANITIGRNIFGYYYSDECEDWSEVNMITAVKVLIKRLARIINHDEIVRDTTEYKIEIHKLEKS